MEPNILELFVDKYVFQAVSGSIGEVHRVNFDTTASNGVEEPNTIADVLEEPGVAGIMVVEFVTEYNREDFTNLPSR